MNRKAFTHNIYIYINPKNKGRANRLVNQCFLGGFTNSLKRFKKCIQEVPFPLPPTIMEVEHGSTSKILYLLVIFFWGAMFQFHDSGRKSKP